MRTRRLILAGAAASVACGAGLAHVAGARACTSGTAFLLGQYSGPPGTHTTAWSIQFANGTVTIHWASPSGPVLTTASAPLGSFNPVGITIPSNVTPGMYWVDAWDGVGKMYVGKIFTVTGPPAAPPPPVTAGNPGSGGTGGTSGTGGQLNTGTGPALGNVSTSANGPATTTTHAGVAPNSPAKQSGVAAGFADEGQGPNNVEQPAAAPPAAGAGSVPGAAPQGTQPQASAARSPWSQILNDLTGGFTPSRAGALAAASPAAGSSGTGTSGALLAVLLTVPALVLGGLGFLVAHRRRARQTA